MSKLYINGRWSASETGREFNSYNPANGSLLDSVADGNREDTANAIHAAEEAFKKWSVVPAIQRSDYLMACYDSMIKNQDLLAEMITREQGKPLKEAINEVGYAASFFRWYAEEARRIYGETLPSNAADKRIVISRQPVGVVAAITPWNFPLAMITRKIAPALAAGCTVVVKPAEQTPLNAVTLFKVLEECNLPPGVINLITTSQPRDVGEELLHNPAVKKITFTGSTDVGKYLTKEASNQMKRVSMELGGHAPFIVFDDADIEDAVNGVIASKFRNAGQTCVCANRIYVQESIMDEFISLFAEKVNAFSVGEGFKSEVDIGPLIDKDAIQKSKNHIEDALNKGAKLITGGKQINGEGNFFEPTILLDVAEDMYICQEETFGPVAPILTFKTENEVIERANNVPYGLAAYFYTNDYSRSIRVSEKLEYGIIGLNDAIPAVAQAPFGGMKESGVGREGGKEGLLDFLETKYISMKFKNECEQ
ncbi:MULTISPECIES: NAD-dependent succinate-semialdehyde dehydrogenase [Bacillaceae]|uniref:NAD-dependent succinate-semialdehyde dehydrogenase n=1 Tax=Bacillaceae TaxID=186817 RepID=UPI000BA6DC39|nr:MULTISPECIES: NAD-dependent succinate-semialdehyde dehydrogenase [Bacillaceae]MCM3704665.1 NAD-dependent succinate-semialdehyde dehydrogenase [Cytobacillus firmus]PAE23863.1 succinate-semialdehyde dehydrogenase (NADP(+)) [Bacillus sp. 7894-2]URM34797.1 NAD-dependent succinate-semialdehyde dehydrogenase [Cytobacillus firmus]